LRLKCTKFEIGCGSAPDPAAGAYSAPPDHPTGSEGAGPLLREESGEDGKEVGM